MVISNQEGAHACLRLSHSFHPGFFDVKKDVKKSESKTSSVASGVSA
jgi:hypothetical protein